MYAIILDGIVWREMFNPVSKANEVLIKVQMATINRAEKIEFGKLSTAMTVELLLLKIKF